MGYATEKTGFSREFKVPGTLNGGVGDLGFFVLMVLLHIARWEAYVFDGFLRAFG